MVIKKADYHIHNYFDICATPEMTFSNIDDKSYSLELEEISVLTHYCQAMPNEKNAWVSWKTVNLDKFNAFIEEAQNYKSHHNIRFFRGVETELMNDKGDINIPLAEQEKIDMVALSVHFLPSMSFIPMEMEKEVDITGFPLKCSEETKSALEKWYTLVESVGVEKVLEGIVNGYMNAVKRFPKVRTLSHAYDILQILVSYHLNPTQIPETKAIEIIEPLMYTLKDHSVLWELTHHEVLYPAILKRANEIGVRFTPTCDAHFLGYHPWGSFNDHDKAEELIEKYGLQKGNLVL